MDEFNENIIDENIQILTPKNSQFLLNKMNMFAMTERKLNKSKKDPYKKEINDKINKKYITQIQSIDEDRNEDLKTIIKDPEILTINRIIEIRNIMRANSNNDVKKHTQNLEKNKKNKITIYKKVKSKEKFVKFKSKKNSPDKSNNNINFSQKINSEKNSIQNNNKKIEQKIINIKKIKKNNNKEKKQNNLKLIHNNGLIGYIHFTNLLSKTRKDLSEKDNKNEKKNFSNHYNSNNKIFVKKLSKEYKNKSMKSSLSNSKKTKKTIITKKIKLKREFLSPKVINRIKNVFFLTQQKLIQNNNERENTIKTSRKDDDKLSNKIIITNKKHILNDKMPEILNKCKSKLFYNDYSHNKKSDLTSVIKGLNIIKDIYFKKLKKIFSSIKMINIYKRKIVKSKSPKGRINNQDNNNLIIINKKIHKINSNDKIFKNKSNPLTYQSISKYNSFHKKRINYNEYEEKTKKAKNEDNNNLLLANPNNYINNCNINSIQINLYNNKENSNDLKRKVNYNKNKIITKNISNKNAEKSYDEFNIINKYKTFFNNEFI
jgi:hypothetical protein